VPFFEPFSGLYVDIYADAVSLPADKNYVVIEKKW
jgi:hypothetical protein